MSNGSVRAVGKKPLLLCVLVQTCCFAADVTGNWVVRDPLSDGTVRRTYFDLKQDGQRIIGHIRLTYVYYDITESSAGSEGFTLTGSMQDGHTIRTVKYEGKLENDELHVTTRRRPDAPPVQLVAHRAPAGEGAMPARLPLPALHVVRSNGLAQTPPMGWNSWNKFASKVDDAGVRATADAVASNGMREAGYVYVNIDDTWEAERDANGIIQTNKKFPDIKALADYVHSKGLKLGIYSSPGPNTCAGYEGSYGHEEQDAKTYAQWGIDYLKYDWCGARNIYKDEEMQAVYQKMGDALNASAAKSPIAFVNTDALTFGNGEQKLAGISGGRPAISETAGSRCPKLDSIKRRSRSMPGRVIGMIRTCSKSAMAA